CEAAGGDALTVHEAGEEVADLAGEGAGLGILRFLDDRAHVLLGLLGEQVEGAPARLVGGDLGGLEPRAVDVAVEVVLGTDGSGELGDGETGGQNVCHGSKPMRPYRQGARAGASAAPTGHDGPGESVGGP